jgi:hypothetical protein
MRSLLARAPACLLCHGTRVRRSSRSYGTILGALFVAVRCQHCGRRFPLPRRVARTEVTVYSRIPAHAPNKGAFESALREALRSVPGSWSDEVRPDRQSDRWFVHIWRPDGETIRVGQLPRDVAGDVVLERIGHALRQRGVIEDSQPGG